MTINPPLKGIFGTGRSGSTWLGAIINSHPDVVYRWKKSISSEEQKQIVNIVSNSWAFELCASLGNWD
ncbi:hypothetical protein [Crocosphaera sp. Alani8]|uniref:hypothetical protein n=1 Tax=Crocosphaera sp. Alani8 TaxID=3038952 RepID=UPI00313DF37F